MSNPQVKFLIAHGISNGITNDIITFLSANKNYHTSHEIVNHLIRVKSNSYNTLVTLLRNKYHNIGGFAEPASHIGSLCSYLSNRGMLSHSIKYCSVLKKKEDAFSI